MKVTPFEEVFKRLPRGVKKAAMARYQGLRREMILRELRESLDITQGQVASKTGIKPSNLSRLERQRDMQISTLRKIIAALGGELEIVAKFKDTDVAVLLPENG
jgi:transcriptional regulator with XRE-family HTH domain